MSDEHSLCVKISQPTLCNFFFHVFRYVKLHGILAVADSKASRWG